MPVVKFFFVRVLRETDTQKINADTRCLTMEPRFDPMSGAPFHQLGVLKSQARKLLNTATWAWYFSIECPGIDARLINEFRALDRRIGYLKLIGRCKKKCFLLISFQPSSTREASF